ncbi:hypothetical protein R6Q59_004467 [Mikania micrantha]
MERYLDSRYDNYFKEIDKYGYLQKYKGVVPQQNGNWGAQIYTNNQRIWLGTFKSETDAAIAYDRASMKLRSVDAPRNFPLTKSTLLEASFQSHYCMETILAIIKDGSYQAKFEDYQRQMKVDNESDNMLSVEKRGFGFSCRVLFQKELTPSDVGKLNRLVIPKKYAVRYFPRVPDEVAQGFANDEFVKDKKLMPKDKITFYYQENLEMQNMGFWVIDTCKSTSHIDSSLKLGVEGDEDSFEDQKVDDEMIQTSNVKTHGLKLFGVHIN